MFSLWTGGEESKNECNVKEPVIQYQSESMKGQQSDFR